jgi:hypothetical protein
MEFARFHHGLIEPSGGAIYRHRTQNRHEPDNPGIRAEPWEDA